MPNDAAGDRADQSAPVPPQGAGRRWTMNLTQVEQRQLRAAHDLAFSHNPGLEETMNEAVQAMEMARKKVRDAMLAADPSLAPVLAKIEPPESRRKQWKDLRQGKWDMSRKWRHHGPPPGMANLSEQESTQLKAAHELTKNDPSVSAARDALKTAATPEARRAALEALRQASDAALLKADPALGPILEKLHQAQPAEQHDDPSPETTPGTRSPAR